MLRIGSVMPNGEEVRSAEGTPQGGPLSPLLANLYLDALDKELEKRPMAALCEGMVGILPIGRGEAAHLRSRKLGEAAHTQMLLATLA